MAICTLKAHVSRALAFYNLDSIWFSIGKSSRWTKDDIDDFDETIDYDKYPPVPKNTDEMKEIIGFKRVEFKAMVVQDDAGTLDYRNVKWRVVDPENAVKEGARWVYVATGLSYNELPVENPYRQIGVHTGLKPVEGVLSTLYALLPNQVSDEGLLEVIDYRKPVYRDMDVRERIKLILEF